MRSLLNFLVLLLHTIEATIARPFGMLFGGFICGFKAGMQDAHNCAKYLAYKRKLLDIKRAKREKDNDTS